MAGLVNVVKDYDWTSIPKGSALRDKAPYVWAKSYKLKSGQISQAIQGYIAIGKNLGGSSKSFYEALYGPPATEEDKDYKFPFFGNSVRSFNNQFGDTFQDGIGGSGGIASALNEGTKGVVGSLGQLANMTDTESLAKAGKALMNKDWAGAGTAMAQGGKAPGTYIETPQFYQYGKNDAGIPVSFILSNTINADQVQKNHDLVVELTKINKPSRKNSIAVDPPHIYRIVVPGQRFIRWAYCSSFSVELLGTKRVYGGVVVPEAYQISMTFDSLTMEPAEFMDELN